MKQGRYDQESQKLIDSIQGSYGNCEEKKWICPECETINTETICLLCGYQKIADDERNDDVGKWKKLIIICSVLGCIIVGVILSIVFSMRENENINVSEALQEVPASAQESENAWKNNLLMKNPHIMFSGISKNAITSVVFIDTCTDAPENAWDISVAQNRSVLAWIEDVAEYCQLYIAGNGGINGMNACQGLFLSYSQLESVDFNNCFYTDEVTDMSQMFYGCEKLVSVNFEGINTSNVTNMKEMFYRCAKLRSLNVKGFDVSNVTDMSYLFTYCSSLPVVDVSSWDTSNVTDMKYMFRDCHSLTSLDVSGWNTSNVRDMSYMFLSCRNLVDLDLAGFDVSRVQAYKDFMTYNAMIDGRPWQDFFQ